MFSHYFIQNKRYNLHGLPYIILHDINFKMMPRKKRRYQRAVVSRVTRWFRDRRQVETDVRSDHQTSIVRAHLEGGEGTSLSSGGWSRGGV